MDPTFLVFGYGSLVFAPEQPHRVLGLKRARLAGYRRTFNKRSRARSCPVGDSFDAFPEVPDAFRADGLNWSLALGTVADERAFIDGLVVEYPVDAHADVLRDTDPREGYDAAREPSLNGYLRHELELQLEDGVRPAYVYLANPDPRNPWYVGELPVELQAKILINATPKSATDEVRADARGLLYLEGVRTRQAERGIVDPALETLAAAVLSFDGPWQALMTAPRRLATGG